MKWGRNIYEVALLYFKVAFVYSAYFGTKIFIAQNRPPLNPPHQAVTRSDILLELRFPVKAQRSTLKHVLSKNPDYEPIPR